MILGWLYHLPTQYQTTSQTFVLPIVDAPNLQPALSVSLEVL